MEILTFCETCEDFKPDVMYRVDPHYEDSKDQLNMRLLCNECDEQPRRLAQDIEDRTCENCGEFKESTYPRVNPFSEDVFDELEIQKLCDECFQDLNDDI